MTRLLLFFVLFLSWLAAPVLAAVLISRFGFLGGVEMTILYAAAGVLALVAWRKISRRLNDRASVKLGLAAG